MKYKELVQFEPINEVVKFHRLEEDEYRKEMVRSYVFSETYEDTIIPEICRNLDYATNKETYGLQIVGTYGTGKSHLMSLVSLLAENKDLLSLVGSQKAAKALKTIAGKYKVIRFELGNDAELWKLITFQMDESLKKWGIGHSIYNDETHDSYKDKLGRMMAQFEEEYPDKGLMIVVDEMLSYLKGRAGNAALNRDLAVLQALGEFSDHSKFRMIYGVQELIYSVPEFQFAADMLNLVAARYRPIEITKQDVQFVTEQRMLKKTDEQKAVIRKHLEKFSRFFPGMFNRIDEYVNLFPVHPSFFENFQQIRIAKSQREILKTLSNKFSKIQEEEIPESQPGLICYDSYWDDLDSAALQTFPDIRRVSEIMQTINLKIEDNFRGPRVGKKALACRIANACAVRILQDSLEKTNGASAETLADDMCYLESSFLDRDFLIDVVSTTASQIITATVGQYFEKNETNQEFHIRVEGGVNYEQKIKDFVPGMSDSNKDSYFFMFLAESLPIDVQQYRPGFRIYKHSVEWKSHKVMLDGYIFMGNPAERDTTHPEQNFYIYFMPIFDEKNKIHGDEPDSVYFHFDKISEEMKDAICLYAACKAIAANVDSSEKPVYEQYGRKYTDTLKTLFDKEFIYNTEVIYQGQKHIATPQSIPGGSKEQVVSNIVSTVLEEYFCQKLENYPKFTLLNNSLTKENRPAMIRGALQKIADPMKPNRDGEAILAGLGLLQENQLNAEGSIYAATIRQLMEAKGPGQVINRDEILHCFYEDDWRSNDYDIGADLEFLVLCSMVALGEIEINYDGGKHINASNLRDEINLPKEAYYSFTNIRKPKGMNLQLAREIFLGIVGRDLSNDLLNPAIYPELMLGAKSLAEEAAKCVNTLDSDYQLNGTKLFNDDYASKAKNRLKALIGLCDKLQNFTTPAKMRNLPAEWTSIHIKDTFKTKELITAIKQTKEMCDKLRHHVNYLNQATQYIPDGNNLLTGINSSLGKLNDIIGTELAGDNVDAYINELAALKKQYIDWYIEEYKRSRISELDNKENQRLLNSKENGICKIICEGDHVNEYFPSLVEEYSECMRQTGQTEVNDSNVSPSYLEYTPYADFNPKTYVRPCSPTELRTKIEDIYERLDEALRKVLKDEQLLKTKDIRLDKKQLALLQKFNDGKTNLEPQNASSLYEIACKLQEFFKPVIISADNMRKVIDHAMTPDDAIEAFRQYIDKQIVGKKREDYRIIFK